MATKVVNRFPELTAEQRLVAEAPPDQLTVVTAGPGTGKTHTLIARLASLVQMHGLNPGQDILVLSFSRAAVHEIRIRTRIASEDARYVKAWTFDSFATMLLAEVDPGGKWMEAGYDGRITAATKAILESDEAADVLRDVKHVVIDEAQDIVGVREELVKAVLASVGGGFTVFGDPAQGIYNFQIDERQSREEGSASFYKWLPKNYANRITEAVFNENHRAKTSHAQQALWAGNEIRCSTPQGFPDIWDRLQKLIAGLQSIGKITESAPNLLRQLPQEAAILCRTNGQALMCSRFLWEKSVPHVYRRGSLDRAVPQWLAVLFLGYDYTTITRSNFVERVKIVLGESYDPEELWLSLKRMDPTVNSSLRINQVAERIRMGRVPDDLLERSVGQLVVSTIHRAKGLEFDTVFIASGPSPRPPPELAELAEETRVLFVALTRPTRTLLRLEVPRFRGLFHHGRADRWVRRFDWRAVDFEVTPDDVDHLEPAGGAIAISEDPAAIQEYIAACVKPGDPIELHLLSGSSDGMPRVSYLVVHDGKPVGVTNDNFCRRLFAFLKLNQGWQVRWPEAIRQLRVDVVDTVAGLSATSKKYGLGENGLWLRVRATGFGSLQF